MKFEELLREERNEGVKVGIEKGIAIGIEKGIEKGINQVVLQMCEKNFSIENIVKATGLSFEDVEKLIGGKETEE